MVIKLMTRPWLILAVAAFAVVVVLMWTSQSDASPAEQFLNELGRYVGPYAG